MIPCACKIEYDQDEALDYVSYCPRHAAAPDLLEGCATAREAIHAFAEMLRNEVTGDPNEGLRRLNCAALADLSKHLGELIAKAEGKP